MSRTTAYLWIAFSLIISSCELREEVVFLESIDNDVSCENAVVNTGRYYQLDKETYLWADEDSSKNFKITNWTLDVCNLRRGLGREYFQALITPQFQSLSGVQYTYSIEDRAVVVHTEDGVKVYPLQLLRPYEVVNDVVDGNYILVAYCHLANLVSVYDRTYCDIPLTFGVSGYTYVDSSETHSFILWDRDTESLWWPTIDQGVSGNFKQYRMNKYNINKWDVMNMVEIEEQFPDAQVLMAGQTVIPPTMPSYSGC